ncbi:hypothetical protein DE146DRAFT_453027 [Phaeosphaeria sp. MPI-PUGE-AT-0046c]|nr:hypothetical protein DE146DRAFT_453027 [Phaeosphaeria sp. MPI-PUGE-AT-0046c]
MSRLRTIGELWVQWKRGPYDESRSAAPLLGTRFCRQHFFEQGGDDAPTKLHTCTGGSGTARSCGQSARHNWPCICPSGASTSFISDATTFHVEIVPAHWPRFLGGVFALIALSMSLCVYQVPCRLRTCLSLLWFSLPPQLLALCKICGPIRRHKDLPTQHGISPLSSSKGLVDLSSLQTQLFQEAMWRAFAGDADMEKQK